MGNNLVPEWVSNIKENNEKEILAAEIKSLKRIAAEATIRADGPGFWKQFLKELKITVDSLATIGGKASITDISALHGKRVKPDDAAREIIEPLVLEVLRGVSC